MNVFDIIGPIMIGPSSSHTAGAVRLGRVANKVLNQEAPKEVMVELSGSFAKTYRGHGTDRALLAGIMGYHSYSEEIRDIFPLPIKPASPIVLCPPRFRAVIPIQPASTSRASTAPRLWSKGPASAAAISVLTPSMAWPLTSMGNTTPSWSPITTVRASLQKSRTSCGKIQRRQHWKLQAFPSCQRGHCHDDD